MASVMAMLGVFAGSADAAIPANYFTVTDAQGVNDVNSAQNDLTQFGRDDSDLSVYKLFWSWDATDQWTGNGQTGDACALFDTDGDTNINFVVCGQIHNPPADATRVEETANSPFVFSCSDAKPDRCTNPVPVSYLPTDVQSGGLTPLSPDPSPPANLITATDPFANANPDQNWPNDSTLEVVIQKSFLPAGAVLVNVCSYPSAGNGGNNNPFDCIVTPGGGFLVIHKVAPSGTTQTFNFTVNPGSIAKTITGSGQTTPIPLVVGTGTSVGETVPPTWTLTDAGCKLSDATTSTGTRAGSTITAIAIQSGRATDCTFTNVGPPSLDFTKTRDAATVSAGTGIGFTLSVTNSGLGPASGVHITDALPTATGLSWTVDRGTAAGTCAISGSALDCSVGTLAAGATATVHISSPTTFASCGTVNNTGNVTSTNGSALPSSSSVAVQCPDLHVTKTADAASVTAGDPIGFTITLTNNGPGTATSSTITDALPTGTGVNWTIDGAGSDTGCSLATDTLSCSFVNLASGAAKHVHITSPTTARSCKTYSNTATADATNHPQVQASASTTVACGAIALSKTADAATVSAGDTIGFVLTATNNGGGEARSVTVTDTLPTTAGLAWSIASQPAGDPCAISGGVLTCEFGTLAAGVSAAVHITSPTTKASCATINNTGEVSTSNDGSAQASDSTTVNCGDIAIDKTGPATAQAGQPVLYTLVVTNPGKLSFLDSNVNVSDALCEAPPLLTTKNGDASPSQLDPGDKWTYTCTVRTLVGQTVVNNVGVVKATDSHGKVLQADDPATTTLTQPPAAAVAPAATVAPTVEAPPKSAVLAEVAASPGTARLTGPSKCVKRPFTARVTGRGISKVVFTLDGKKLKTVKSVGNRTVFKVKVKPRAHSTKAQRLVARVTFKTSTKTKARTLRLVFLGCRQAVTPQFTG